MSTVAAPATNSADDVMDFTSGARVAVLLPLPLAGPYDYRVGAGMTVQAGDIVDVPLGHRRATGVVWGKASDEVAASKLKDIHEILDVAPIAAPLRKLVDWVAAYTLYPQGAVLRMVLSVPDALIAPKPVIAYALAKGAPDVRATKARTRVIEFCRENPPLPAADIAREAGCGTAVVKGLHEAGVLASVTLEPNKDWPLPNPDHGGVTLSANQTEAAHTLAAQVGAGFSVTLLDGVPGSGKTEVYF